MPSPFPGMDPFIEASGRWPDFHANFISVCREQLLRNLPAKYDAGLEVRLELFDQGDRTAQSFLPDVSVIQKETEQTHSPAAFATVDLEPVSVRTAGIELDSVGYIEIRSVEGQVVTVIEVLSPTNKREPNRTDYLAKMEAFRQTGVHVVEIDLLLGGVRLESVDPLPAGDYYTFVSRQEKPRMAEVYCWSIRRKLPTLPIPLLSPDADISLDLNEAFVTTFDRGEYRRRVRYDLQISSLNSESDRQWVTSVATSQT